LPMKGSDERLFAVFFEHIAHASECMLNASNPQSVSRLIPLLFASTLVLMSKILSH